MPEHVIAHYTVCFSLNVEGRGSYAIEVNLFTLSNFYQWYVSLLIDNPTASSNVYASAVVF